MSGLDLDGPIENPKFCTAFLALTKGSFLP